MKKNSWKTKIEEDENGEAIIILPDEIVEEWNLKEGDSVDVEVKEGKLFISKPNQA